jgi:GDPmannose 4,6-dehydratase
MRVDKVALITGISGQDGYYLSHQLLSAGYFVIGTSRSHVFPANPVYDFQVEFVTTDYGRDHLRAIIKKFKPDVIFNLAGQSLVSKSWEVLEETLESQGVLTGRLLDIILSECPQTRLMNMASSEIFDHNLPPPFSEYSPMRPHNPYGCAQQLGLDLVRVYREKKGLWAANSILFPHESPRRKASFLFPKIAKAAIDISRRGGILPLGNLHVRRDWGCAATFMEGVYRQSQLRQPTDLVFCTGTHYSVEEVVRHAFGTFGLDYRDYVEVDDTLVRNYEPECSFGTFALARDVIGWQPKYDGLEILGMVVSAYTNDMKDLHY